ncbi:MAG: tRNA pseudouridine(38-40) synthase TruA [Nitrospirota bacterium]
MLRNIKLILEYDGTNYHGWQSQQGSGMPTIQDALEEALRKLTKEDIRTVSSGRTDAGVHALGHVANFPTESPIPAEAWAPALNRLLPKDIRVIVSDEVKPDFHARFSARGKQYRYVVLARSAPSALLREHAWHVDRKLNLTKMRRAALHLLGKHDFSAFRSSACNAKVPVRRLKTLSLRKKGDQIEFILEADAFLMHMARNIVGTLVEVGLGRFSPDDVKKMLKSRDRTTAGRTAPAYGLYLVQVFYSRS